MAQERPTPNPEMIAELYLDEIKCFSSSNGIEEETVFPVVSRSRINFARHSGKRLAIELTIAALPWCIQYKSTSSAYIFSLCK